MNDEVSVTELYEKLEQTRFELEKSRKTLQFKESLLWELETDNEELRDLNKALKSTVTKLKNTLALRNNSLSSDEGLEDCYTSREELEASLPERKTKQSSSLLNEAFSNQSCQECHFNRIDKDELHVQIEELHQQIKHLQGVNQLLQSNVDSQAAQITKLSAELSEEEHQSKRLQAALDYLKMEKELALKDLHDFHDPTLLLGRFSDFDGRGVSIGSSIGEELGLDSGCLNFGEPADQTYDWDAVLDEPDQSRRRDSVGSESAASETSASVDRSSVECVEPDEPPVDCETDTLPEETSETLSELGSRDPLTTDWSSSYVHGGFGWNSFICCVPMHHQNRKAQIFRAQRRQPFSFRDCLERLFRKRAR